MEKLNTFENKQEQKKTETAQIHVLKSYFSKRHTCACCCACVVIILGACGNACGATFMLALPTSDHSSERCKVPV